MEYIININQIKYVKYVNDFNKDQFKFKFPGNWIMINLENNEEIWVKSNNKNILKALSDFNSFLNMLEKQFFFVNTETGNYHN